MKRYRWTWIFFLFMYKISGFVLCNSVDGEAKVRKTRNVICSYGLTDLIKDTLYFSLEDAQKQDPLALDDAWNGRLHHGFLRGLSTLTNTTDLEVFCNEEDMIISSTTLRMKDALAWYKWTVLHKVKGSVWMEAKEVDFDLQIRLNTTNGLNFTVTNSLVTKLEDFKVGFKGLGVLNPVMKQILKAIYKSWKLTVPEKIGLLIKKALEKKLGRISRSLDWLTFL